MTLITIQIPLRHNGAVMKIICLIISVWKQCLVKESLRTYWVNVKRFAHQNPKIVFLQIMIIPALLFYTGRGSWVSFCFWLHLVSMPCLQSQRRYEFGLFIVLYCLCTLNELVKCRMLRWCSTGFGFTSHVPSTAVWTWKKVTICCSVRFIPLMTLINRLGKCRPISECSFSCKRD